MFGRNPERGREGGKEVQQRRDRLRKKDRGFLEGLSERGPRFATMMAFVVLTTFMAASSREARAEIGPGGKRETAVDLFKSFDVPDKNFALASSPYATNEIGRLVLGYLHEAEQERKEGSPRDPQGFNKPASFDRFEVQGDVTYDWKIDDNQTLSFGVGEEEGGVLYTFDF